LNRARAAGETALDDLARRTVRALLACSGGRRGVLVLGQAHEDGLRASLVAEAGADGRDAVHAVGTGGEGNEGGELGVAEGLPLTVLDHVVRSRAPVCLDDLAHPDGCPGTFQADPYLAQARPGSILCVPLVGSSGVLGVVYLESALACRLAERAAAVELVAALAIAALEGAQRLVAQERLASLGMIASGVAHEIKNPLNFVNNFAELSIDLASEIVAELGRHRDRLPPDRAAYLVEIVGDLEQNAVKIREHGRRADGIVRDMLQHSRGRAGLRREVDFNAMVAEHARAAVEAQAASGPAGAALTLTLDPELARIAVVPEEMGRVVLNLVNNALDATRARRLALGEGFAPEVVVTTRELGDRVEVRVRDNGGGIPAAVRERVYRPFFTTKPTGEGTGLGLSLSRDIVVERHGGELGFSTEEGESTEFVIVIPRREPA
jgi:signal transduction histidine kinase